MEFYEVTPSLENYWRSVILFGRNVASYKFALGHALLEVSEGNPELIRLEDLALPFARHISRHLKGCDKQATSSSSKVIPR